MEPQLTDHPATELLRSLGDCNAIEAQFCAQHPRAEGTATSHGRRERRLWLQSKLKELDPDGVHRVTIDYLSTAGYWVLVIDDRQHDLAREGLIEVVTWLRNFAYMATLR